MTLKLLDVNRFMDNARINLPGALDGSIKQELFNVLTEFFDKTDLWYEDVDVPVTTANTVGSTTDFVAIEGYPNRLLGVVDENKIGRRMSMPQPGVLQFGTVPGQDATWLARVALNISDPIPAGGALAGFPNAPDWALGPQYYQGILDGVIGTMMAQVAKPYSNQKIAQYRLIKFKNVISKGKTQARHQNLYGGQNWRFPSFGGSGTLNRQGGL